MYGLSNDLLIGIEHIMARNERIQEAILFGSRAKGNFRPGSDIDIALKGVSLSLKDVIQLSIDLDDLETPYRFDLVIYHRIDEPALREHIDRVGQVLYQKSLAPTPG